MQDQITGNITLDRADTFVLEFDYQDEGGSLVNLSHTDMMLHVGSNNGDVLFSLSPTRDPIDPFVVKFVFTAAHASLLGKKEYDWIIREVVDGVPDVLASGATISAVGFAIPPSVHP